MENKTPKKAIHLVVNAAAAPKTIGKFREWHKQACKRDPLSADDRFKQLQDDAGEAEKSEESTDTEKVS